MNLVVREEHLWSAARYMPGSLGELDSLGLPSSEIRFHDKTLLALVEKAQALPEEASLQPMLNLVDMPGYRKVPKAIRSLITNASGMHRTSAKLLALCRQINQLLNWHWKLKPQNNLPGLIFGWRGGLMTGALHDLLQGHPQQNLPEPDWARPVRLRQITNLTAGGSNELT